MSSNRTRSLSPRSLAPRSLPPRSLSPRSLAPRSLAPRSLAPRSRGPLSLAPRSLRPPSPNDERVGAPLKRTIAALVSGYVAPTVACVTHLSADGAYVDGVRDCLVGDQLDLEFSLPGVGLVQLAAEVSYVQQTSIARGTVAGVGVIFHPMDPLLKEELVARVPRMTKTRRSDRRAA
jgi:hypothetical protein